MSTTPTAALTFQDLIVEVALKLGVAHYGDAGGEEPQIPRDVHDLAICKRHVNNAIRMFLADAPVSGWRWTRPVQSTDVWPSVGIDFTAAAAWVTATAYVVGDAVTQGGSTYICLVDHTSGVFAADLLAVSWRLAYTVSSAYEPTTDKTTVTASASLFYESMEAKSIVVTDVDTYPIYSYVSTTEVTLDGNQHWDGSKTFSIAADGGYTLPRTFAGQYTGPIHYEAGSDTGSGIEWMGEAVLRQLRENQNAETGDPRLASVRLIPGQRRRWELLVYPTPSAARVLEFPYDLYFDALVGLTEAHPAGFQFDEAVKDACFAVLERDDEDVIGGLMSYYRQISLPNAHRTDARSTSRNLGYAGNPDRAGRRPTAQEMRAQLNRPEVTLS